jgi:hypothetical protein
MQQQVKSAARSLLGTAWPGILWWMHGPVLQVPLRRPSAYTLSGVALALNRWSGEEQMLTDSLAVSLRRCLFLHLQPSLAHCPGWPSLEPVAIAPLPSFNPNVIYHGMHGSTLLHTLVEIGCKSLIEVMLEGGVFEHVDWSLRNHAGLTPLDLAYLKKQENHIQAQEDGAQPLPELKRVWLLLRGWETNAWIQVAWEKEPIAALVNEHMIPDLGNIVMEYLGGLSTLCHFGLE